MTPEEKTGIPQDAQDWHPAEKAAPPETTEDANQSPTEESARPQSEAVIHLQPTRENPIKEMRIGLWQTLGQVDRPTRVVVTMEDGRTASIPWEQAEEHLPPEFKDARELGERARRLERQSRNLVYAIRGGTDVMQSRGHVKDALLRPLGKERPAMRYLNRTTDLDDEISGIAQESFMELRRMTNGRESRARELDELRTHLDNCEQRLNEIRGEAFRDLPKIQEVYEHVYLKPVQESRRVSDGSQPEMPESKNKKSLPQ